ncbi:hypothetical protein ACJW31_10G086900 [Castanea mollissima]
MFKPKVLNWFQKSFNMSSFFLQKCCSQSIVSRRNITRNAMSSSICIGITIIWVPCKIKRKPSGVKHPSNCTIQLMSSIILICFLQSIIHSHLPPLTINRICTITPFMSPKLGNRYRPTAWGRWG